MTKRKVTITFVSAPSLSLIFFDTKIQNSNQLLFLSGGRRLSPSSFLLFNAGPDTLPKKREISLEESNTKVQGFMGIPD